MNVNVNEILSNWLKKLYEHDLPNYDKLPDFDLYMEQMLNFLEKQSYILEKNSKDKQITSSMINNYVKNQIVPSPKSKKYTKKQVSLLCEIIYLKNALTLPEIKQIYDVKYSDNNFRTNYNAYTELERKSRDDAYKYTNTKLNKIDTNDENELTNLALDLATKASAYENISKRILYLLKILKNVNEENENIEE